ncbi:hypothetical protein OMP43_17425 [Sphingomonas sp. CBMAI 2297]|uniref:hypothetical protein n=1 Tax=Sphingomonas sp. CBMAI 2297 TaxID=2991720 RepID=UPI002454CD0D|nr:hypothetical protein [Sphingomonas sp. CBMAI 2297]MDH4745809.1 hypothetical protein [Sphingomonas sp. CBMAI 2297]
MNLNLPPWAMMVSLVVGMIGSAGFGGVLKTWLDHQRGKRKQSDEVAMAMAARLEERVKHLEASRDDERARCEAELRVQGQRINNQRLMIFSLLHLFEVPAARRKPMLDAIRTELAGMEAAEGMLIAAPIAAE